MYLVHTIKYYMIIFDNSEQRITFLVSSRFRGKRIKIVTKNTTLICSIN